MALRVCWRVPCGASLFYSPQQVAVGNLVELCGYSVAICQWQQTEIRLGASEMRVVSCCCRLSGVLGLVVRELVHLGRVEFIQHGF